MAKDEMAIPEGRREIHANNGFGPEVPKDPPIRIQGLTAGSSNLLKPDQATKNPASEPTERGADQDMKRIRFRDENSPVIATESTQIFLSRNHERAARVIGYALTLDTSSGWTAAGAILAARLKRQERGSLAYAALWSMEAAEAELVARVALRGTGMPGAPLLGVMDEAEFWADRATVQERKAYALACYNRLSERDRAAFLAHVQGVTT